MGILIISLKQNRGFFTHPKRIVFFFIASLVFISFFFVEMRDVLAAPGVNQTINFQGKVANADGTNVADGSYDFVFRLYKASSGGSAQWTETWDSENQVAVADGIFQVALGSLQSMSALDFNDDSWYLSVEFNNDDEMDPRIRFASVPYALNASKVSGLTVTNTTGTFTLEDGKTFTVNNTLGLSGTDGTTFTFPSTTGTVVTEAFAQTLTNKTIGSTGLTFSGASTDITTATDEGLTITAAGTGDITFGTDADTDIILSGTAFTTNNNSVLFTNGSGVIGAVTTTSTDLCLVSNGTGAAPTWESCPGAGNGSNWVLNPTNGTISPINNTLDLLLGGTATSSAKFAVLNLDSGIPTASVSAMESGTGLALGGDGSIQSLLNSTLTIGGNTTGNIHLSALNNSGTVAINTLPNSLDPDLFSGAEVGGSVSTTNVDAWGVAGLTLSSTLEANSSEDLYGMLIYPTISVAGEVEADVYGGYIAFWDADISGAVDDAYMLYLEDPSWLNPAGNSYSLGLDGGIYVGGAGSDATNNYGLYLSDGIGDDDTSWSIYSETDAQSFFAGKVGIGTGRTTPSGQLEVGGEDGEYLSVSSKGDITFVNENSFGSSITGPNGSGLFIESANGHNLVLGAGGGGDLRLQPSSGDIVLTPGGSSFIELKNISSGTAADGLCLNSSDQLITCSVPGSGGASPFQVLSGALTPLNSTLDFLIGGQATASAKFAILNVNGTGPATASVSGNLIVMPNNGAGGRVGIGTTASTTALEINSETGSNLRLTYNDNDGGATNFTDLTTNSSGHLIVNSSGGDIHLEDHVNIWTADGITIGAEGKQLSFFSTGGGIDQSWSAGYDLHMGWGHVAGDDVLIGAGGNGVRLGVGVSEPLASLHVNGNYSNHAAAIVNQLNSGDIFTASAGGTTRFSITNSGGIKLGTDEGGSGECLLSQGAGSGAIWDTCPGGSGGVSSWVLNAANGTLNPINNTLDLLIGGTGTTSAKFAFVNVAGGDPTLKIMSADSANSLDFYHDGTNAYITTDTGEVVIGDGTGGIVMEGTISNDTITNNGAVAVGDKFAVEADEDDLSAATINNDGSGDILSASASGAFRFSVGNDGSVRQAEGLTINSNDNDIASGVQFGTTTPVYVHKSAAGELSITDNSGNAFVFDTVNGPAYTGSARPAKTITLSPEYAGAVLTDFYGAGTDTNITGSMTSDTDTTQGTSIRNYYQWERTTDATQHFYTVAVRVTLPADFSAWATSNALVVNYITESGTNTVSDLDVRVYNENSATAVASSTDNASTSWTTIAIDDSTLDDGASSEWDAAGETAVIYLRMGSASGNYVRVGDITLNYLASH